MSEREQRTRDRRGISGSKSRETSGSPMAPRQDREDRDAELHGADEAHRLGHEPEHIARRAACPPARAPAAALRRDVTRRTRPRRRTRSARRGAIATIGQSLMPRPGAQVLAAARRRKMLAVVVGERASKPAAQSGRAGRPSRLPSERASLASTNICSILPRAGRIPRGAVQAALNRVRGHAFRLVAQPVHGLRPPLHVLLRQGVRAAGRPSVGRALRVSIRVKVNVAEVLRIELARKSWRGEPSPSAPRPTRTSRPRAATG